MKKVYCTAPFNSLTIREDGIVRTCCSGTEVLGDLNVESIDSIYKTNPVILNIRTELLEGKIPKNCNFCYQQELNSETSIRQLYDRFPSTDVNLVFLDIRWNTLCNLTCIYCSELFSSSWASKQNSVRTCKGSKDYNKDLLAWILENSEDLQEVMLVGGEPLLMKENKTFLEHIKDDINVSLITNLSYDLKKNPNAKILVDKFKNVSWNVSAENTGLQLNYVRHGIDYQLFEENLQYLKDNNCNVKSLIVYGIFSSFSLSTTVKKFVKLGIVDFQISIVTANPVLDLFNYSREILKKARRELINTIKWFDKNATSSQSSASFNLLLKKLDNQISQNASSQITKEQFLLEIDNYNKFNSLRFEDVFEKEYELIIKNV